MKAIHNTPEIVNPVPTVGNYKLKYNFESNSQHALAKTIKGKVRNYKLKYNFESNSQPIACSGFTIEVGNYKLKYNFESNSQQFHIG